MTMTPAETAELVKAIERIADLRRERANWQIFAESADDRIRRLTEEIDGARGLIDLIIAGVTSPPARVSPGEDSAVIAPDVLPDVAPAA